MCGIAGFFGQPGTSSGARERQCHAMLDAIAHRGPDGSGVWLEPELPLALGHRRLAVVELSDAGRQPMVSHDGRLTVVFNGEIYNHAALRRRLEQSSPQAPFNWRGHSDTETLLGCISAWGIEVALQACEGMFAFALWDRQQRQLTLARDRLGEKPLYYGWQRGCLLFGSELKALRAHDAFEGRCNWAAAAAFLRHNYVPAPHSIYENIYKLLPGTYLTLNVPVLEGRQAPPAPAAYWSLSAAALAGARQPFAGRFEEAVDELEMLLKSAVRQQSLADVPVGAFLSGGVDSSLVVALMKSTADAQVHTFSVGMPAAGMDESAYAQAVAQHLGTRHLSHRLEPSEALQLIPRLPTVWDEPLGDSSQLPTYLVSRLARQHVTVSLSGDGGDEFFLGYAQYPTVESLWRTRALRHLPWKPLLAALRLGQGVPVADRLKRRADTVLSAWQQPDPGALGQFWTDRYRQAALPLRRDQATSEPLAFPVLQGAAATAGLWDAGTYLPDDILVKVDRAAMANSLETRAPLLDHRVVEFALSLPQSYKLLGRDQKRVLKAVLYRHVPRQLVDRPKMGFAIPMAGWLRLELKDWAASLLDTTAAGSSPFDHRAIQALWAEHQSGQRDHTERLWGVLSLLMFMSPS